MHARPIDEIRSKVTALIASILAGNEIDRNFSPEDSLPDIGLTSVDMVNLMLGLEAEFDITIPQDDITPEHFRSVTTIEVLIAKVLGAGGHV
ncbi:MAG: phosphopantetheine-binding protein [Burkholderiales bacterium]